MKHILEKKTTTEKSQHCILKSENLFWKTYELMLEEIRLYFLEIQPSEMFGEWRFQDESRCFFFNLFISLSLDLYYSHITKENLKKLHLKEFTYTCILFMNIYIYIYMCVCFFFSIDDLKDWPDTAKLLSPENVNKEALMEYAREAADFSTNYQLPHMDFAVNHYGKPDVAMFDFTSMFAAENASRVIERRGHKLLMCLVGDSLLEVSLPYLLSFIIILYYNHNNSNTCLIAHCYCFSFWLVWVLLFVRVLVTITWSFSFIRPFINFSKSHLSIDSFGSVASTGCSQFSLGCIVLAIKRINLETVVWHIFKWSFVYFMM